MEMTEQDKFEKLRLSAEAYLRPDRFYDFCRVVMDRDLEPDPHGEMCAVAQFAVNSFEDYYVRKVTPGPEDKNYYLILAPRDSFKSTVFNECLAVWLILKHPDIRILVDSETITKAAAFVSAIQSHLESNKVLRAMYGALDPKKRDDSLWTREKFTVSTRTKVGLREPTVTASGIGKSKPGMHYDVIIADDLVSEKNVTTDEQIEKTNEHIKLSGSLLSPGGLLLVVGTRWHFYDPYGYIINDPDQSSVYNVYIRGAKDSDGKLYFPTRLTQAFLDKKRKIQGSYIYSCQYMNDPVPEGEQAFDVNLYNVISEDEFKNEILPSEPYNWFFLVDPALTEGEKKRGDYTAIMPFVFTKSQKFYFYRMLAVKEGPEKLVDTVYNHHRLLCKELGHPYASRLEQVAFQKLFVTLLKIKEEEHGHKIHWQELKPDNKTNKEVRIRSAIPYLQAGDFVIVEGSSRAPSLQTLTGANKMLVDQALRFPLVKNDDLLDLQGYAVHLKAKPRGQEKKKKKLDFDYDWGDNDDEPIGEVDMRRPTHWPQD